MTANGFEIAVNCKSALGNDKDYLATRLSYKLNLKGPSVNVEQLVDAFNADLELC
jgi:hypothetical protein